jgi:hypothetical protein
MNALEKLVLGFFLSVDSAIDFVAALVIKRRTSVKM